MRIIFITIGALIVSFAGFLTVKMWGQSTPYIEYKNPVIEGLKQHRVVFYKPKFENIDTTLKKTAKDVYLDIANTKDQKVVIVKPEVEHKNDVRNQLYDDVKDHVLLLEDYKDALQHRKVILNIVENAIAGHLIFIDEVKKLGLDKTDNLFVVTPYETLSKAIKENAPTLIYGASMPEILRIKSMESLNLIEAATFRADVIIHPLKFSKNQQDFYSDTLLKELQRRYRQFIVGPISESQQIEAEKLNPLATIIQE